MHTAMNVMHTAMSNAHTACHHVRTCTDTNTHMHMHTYLLAIFRKDHRRDPLCVCTVKAPQALAGPYLPNLDAPLL